MQLHEHKVSGIRVYEGQFFPEQRWWKCGMCSWRKWLRHLQHLKITDRCGLEILEGLGKLQVWLNWAEVQLLFSDSNPDDVNLPLKSLF